MTQALALGVDGGRVPGSGVPVSRMRLSASRCRLLVTLTKLPTYTLCVGSWGKQKATRMRREDLSWSLEQSHSMSSLFAITLKTAVVSWNLSGARRRPRKAFGFSGATTLRFLCYTAVNVARFTRSY